MATSTPTIGLKKPEGSDPFLTEDFASNYDKIDAAFAARPPAGSGGGIDATTLGGSPKSYFYGPHNPPPATGVGAHTHNDYLTEAAGDQRYARISHGVHGGTSGGAVDAYTKSESDSRYVAKDTGLGGLPESVMHTAQGKQKTRVCYGNTIWSMNGSTDQFGADISVAGVYATNRGAPAVFATAHTHAPDGSGDTTQSDPIITINVLTTQMFRVRLNTRDSQNRSMTSIFSWMTVGQSFV